MSEKDVKSRMDAFLSPDTEQEAKTSVNTSEESTEVSEEENEVSKVENNERPEGKIEEKADENSGEQEEQVEIEDLNGLAEHLGVDVADLYGIKISVSEGMESKQITIGDYKDSYTSKEEISKRQQELDKKHKAFEDQKKSYEKQYVDTLHQAAKIVERAEGQILEDLKRIDWDKLRGENPSEYVIKQHEFQQRQMALNQLKQEVNNEAVKAMQDRKVKMTEEYNKILAREGEALLKAIPGWKKEDVRSAERQEVVNYLVNQGYSEAQILGSVDKEGNIENPGLIDHRQIAMARKAMLYDKELKNADIVKKKVLTIGKKPLKPGSQISKSQAKVDQLSEAKARLKKTGSDKDAVQAIRNLL